MATFIYFRPFSSSQRLFSMEAKTRNPPPPICMCCLLICFKSNSEPPTKSEKPTKISEHLNMWAHLYVTCLQCSPPHPHLPSRPGGTHANTPPPPPPSRTNTRKVSVPIQAVPRMTPSPVLRWPDQPSLSSPLTFSRDLSSQMSSSRKRLFVGGINRLSFCCHYYYFMTCDNEERLLTL